MFLLPQSQTEQLLPKIEVCRCVSVLVVFLGVRHEPASSCKYIIYVTLMYDGWGWETFKSVPKSLKDLLNVIKRKLDIHRGDEQP